GHVHDYPVRLINYDIGPFSFWQSIYINPANLSPADLKNVLEHEQAHVSEWHTLDILLAELSTIFYWFNPGVWLMKKAVRENIEFITDRKILQKGMDSKEYQYSLVSVSLATAPNTIVNNFNISTIKKRIIMMNSKRSPGYNLTRYVFLVPAVVALLLVFSLSKAETAKKELNNTFRAITNVVSRVEFPNSNKSHVALSAKKAAITDVLKVRKNNADTIYAGKSKDGNKSFLISSKTSPDSINYVINGAKATKADLKALDPGRIYSLELVTADQAKQFFPDLDNKQKVLFVTTDDSDAGKKLKEKMDKTVGAGRIATTKNITIIKNGSGDIAPKAVGSGSSYTITSDNAPAAVVSGDTVVIADVVVKTNPKIKVRTKNHSTQTITYTIKTKGNADGAPEVYNVDVDPIKLHTDSFRVSDDNQKIYLDKVVSDEVVINSKNVKKIAFSKTNNNESTIDNFSNSLIIIDGKESKGLKNVPASEIKSITILKNEAAEKLYGKRGRNGVIVITTKKGSK
ncbi:MAG: M56 family metallopeptidase, partial [Mucilaginibacter sp.]